MNFEWLADVPTLWGTVLHTLFYVVLVIWIWRRPRDEFTTGAADQAPWRDLRWWIVPLAVLQVALYWVF